MNNRIRKVDTSGIITTVAGNETFGYSGDGGDATSTPLYLPYAVAVDSTEYIFIADSMNSRIRRVDTSGIITTVAGNGTSGYSGDDGDATSAQLGHPQGVAVDSAGNIFIADSNNHRIRRVDKSGIITTVAGIVPFVPYGYGYSGDDSDATNAKLYYPRGVTVDSAGNIFIADTYNSCIRRVDTSGIITTVVGNGTSGYSGDDGDATSAQLSYPQGVAVDSAGNIFIADVGNNRVRKVWSLPFVYGNVVISIAGHTDLSVANATLALEGASSYQKMTTGEGNFFIDNVVSGNYVLTISFPDLAPISQEITISDESMNLGTLHMTVYSKCDINNDGITGLEEAIHALQVVSGLRSEE